MAKQSVSFVERHLEKIVVGVAGLITLAIAAMSVVMNPHSIESSGGTLGPGEIGVRLKEEAKQVYQSILNAKPKQVPVPDYAVEVGRSRPSELDRGLLPRLTLAMTPLNPLPPAVVQVNVTGKSRLASTLPPGKPVVFQGRNRATLAAPSALSGVTDDARNAAAAGPEAASIRDLTWVTVAVPVFRARQLEEFNAAGYLPGRNTLVLARVRLERQRLLGDGSWSEPPQPVETYTKYLPFNPPEIRLITDETGEVALDPESIKRLDAMQGALSREETQEAIWRPPLATYLDTATWPPTGAPHIEGIVWEDWLERELPGSQFKGQQLGGERPVITPLHERRPTRREPTPVRPTTPPSRLLGGGEGGRMPAPIARDTSSGTKTPTPAKTNTEASEERKANSTARERLREADKKLNKEKDPLAADQLLSQILNDTKLPSNITREAQRLKEKVDESLLALQEKEAKRKGELEARQQGLLDVDVEPLWAHDLTAQPGRTYRYRVQIELCNPYSRFPSELSDPHDAEKVFLASDWSEWSDPVPVRPDTYAFVTEAAKEGDNGTVTMDLYKWVGGEWLSVPRQKFEIGQQVVCDDRKAGHVDTQMTVLDIESDARRLVRSKLSKKDGSFDIGPKSGLKVVLLAGPDGQVWERNTFDDRNSAAELKSELKKEAEKENQPRTPIRDIPPRLGGIRGGS